MSGLSASERSDLFESISGKIIEVTRANGERLRALGADGELIDCEAIAFFESPLSGRSILLFAEREESGSAERTAYATYFDPEAAARQEDSVPLHPISEEKEWDIVQTVLKAL